MAPVTSLYAGLLGLLFLTLSIRVIRVRRRQRVKFGDGGDAELTARVRAHGNCAEYGPVLLLLLLLAEIQGAPAFALHILGIIIVAGRVFHAISTLSFAQWGAFRVAGMTLTFAALFTLALGLFAHGLV
ncbi:MAPEG family protein [Thalassococcus sp. S3]|uniref:MAPEG family protein n=1 Tax=Thalassococcus sp. S3 TaxID=2017482 RepID=UPI0010243167|nr:MAPEG family protein [Thalassococcus sp. S3]QBF31232.1 hypothetical protein CFI11_08380 [Thalassococcus sp. S3]